MKIFWAPAMAVAFLAQPAFAQALTKTAPASATPQVVVAKVFDSDRTALGQKIVLPHGDVHVVVTTYDIPPGAKLPVHEHPSARYAYVLSGRLTVETADHKHKFSYKAGDFLVEMRNVWHFGANMGSQPVRLLVIDQVDGDKSNTVLKR
jgi:quercetin dioxygenase-like cupin family protein